MDGLLENDSAVFRLLNGYNNAKKRRFLFEKFAMTKKNSIFVVCKWRKIMERNAQTYEEILNAINEHLKSSGRKYYSDFYIGVSEDAAKQLVEKHHVGRRDWWIYRAAETPKIARDVAAHYLKLGMRGTPPAKSKVVNARILSPKMEISRRTELGMRLSPPQMTVCKNSKSEMKRKMPTADDMKKMVYCYAVTPTTTE